MGEHPISQRIIELLQQHQVWYEVFEHEPVRTSQDAADVRPEYSMRQGAKALIVRAKVGREAKKFIMLVLPADQRFNSSKAKKLLGAKDMRFATEDEVSTVTDGVKPGGVPPFGNLFGLQVIADPTLFDNEKIIFNAGRNVSIAIRSTDYQQIVQPAIERRLVLYWGCYNYILDGN
jgi:prolyl-tRNA editing enzyme YbaK/EbsC (Cys-tRNA(Pro) deacylase)